MLLLLPKNCSYADASGAGKDVYEFVSWEIAELCDHFAFTNGSQLLLFYDGGGGEGDG